MMIFFGLAAIAFVWIIWRVERRERNANFIPLSKFDFAERCGMFYRNTKQRKW